MMLIAAPVLTVLCRSYQRGCATLPRRSERPPSRVCKDSRVAALLRIEPYVGPSPIRLPTCAPSRRVVGSRGPPVHYPVLVLRRGHPSKKKDIKASVDTIHPPVSHHTTSHPDTATPSTHKPQITFKMAEPSKTNG